MQDEQELFSRRHFLQWTAAGAAAAGAQSLIPRASAQPTRSAKPRTAPALTIKLASTELHVTLDVDTGLPYEYHLRTNDSRLRGEDPGEPIQVTLCRKQPWAFATSRVQPHGHKVSSDGAVFHFRADYGGTKAAEFSLNYLLRDSTLLVTMDGIQEQPGFELIDVNMPALVTVRETDEKAWLAHGDDGGSLTMLAAATPGNLPLDRFWGNIQGTLPIVMVGTARALCVQETTAYMDGTLLAVAGDPGSRRASIGTDKVHRVNGSACYDLNLAKGKPRNCGNQNTPNLLVEQTSTCRLDFLTVTGDPAKAWISAGKLVRDRMPEIPTTFYNDKYVYGIRCDEPKWLKPKATFEQAGEVVKRVAALIDHSPQIVHLWGWQFRGKDTGYPAVNVVDERLGGYDGMMRLMREGEASNATITLSDNYDDAYRSSPAWDEAMIARRPDGQLWESREWTGERSYIQGLAKYMEGPGEERVRYTCERYQLKHTTHVDVLSYYAIRNDWDPAHPASGIRNLVDGRYKVLEGFAAHGVDVSSEALRYPMIGHISCFWYLTGNNPCPFGGTHIPLVPLIYGKSAVWGLSGSGAKGDPATVRILQRFYGASPHSILSADSDPADFLDAFYLGMVPFFALRGRIVEDFERSGEHTRIHLEGGAVIESDLATKSIQVSLNGVEVLRDDAVFCPVGEDKVACYSISPQTITTTLPTGWKAEEAVAVALYPDHRERVETQVEASGIRVSLESRRPIMLYRNHRAAQV